MPSFKLQFDYHGRHRIVGTFGETVITGQWANYRSLSFLLYASKTYIAASACGLLPQDGVVYEVSPQPTTVDRTFEYIDSQGQD